MIQKHEKEYINEQVDFLLKEKTKKDIDKIMNMMSIIVTQNSHKQFSSGFVSKGFMGHVVRKNYRRDLLKYAKLQLTNKFANIQQNGNAQ
jgi:hypothetical protein